MCSVTSFVLFINETPKKTRRIQEYGYINMGRFKIGTSIVTGPGGLVKIMNSDISVVFFTLRDTK